MLVTILAVTKKERLTCLLRQVTISPVILIIIIVLIVAVTENDTLMCLLPVAMCPLTITEVPITRWVAMEVVPWERNEDKLLSTINEGTNALVRIHDSRSFVYNVIINLQIIYV